MAKNVIWQRCPKCGNWCKAESGLLVNAAKGFLDCASLGDKFGKRIGKIWGTKGEETAGKIGTYLLGMSLGVVNGAKEVVVGEDTYFFECKCGYYWTINDPTERQNAEYGKELTNNFMSLPYLKRKHVFVCEEVGDVPASFRVLPIANVPSGMIFPTGHPIVNTLYVCHPYRTDYYFPYETYEIYLLRDELREFKKIMKKLGAKHIDSSDVFNHVEENKKTISDILEGSVDNLKYQIQGSYEKDVISEAEKVIRNELEESWDGLLTNDKPKLPENLVWYYHREEWKDECENRLEGRTIRYSFTISVLSSELTNEQEREQINAELKVLHSASVNGSYKNSKSFSLRRKSEMTWRVNVEFYPLSDYEKE